MQQPCWVKRRPRLPRYHSLQNHCPDPFVQHLVAFVCPAFPNGCDLRALLFPFFKKKKNDDDDDDDDVVVVVVVVVVVHVDDFVSGNINMNQKQKANIRTNKYKYKTQPINKTSNK